MEGTVGGGSVGAAAVVGEAIVESGDSILFPVAPEPSSSVERPPSSALPVSVSVWFWAAVTLGSGSDLVSTNAKSAPPPISSTPALIPSAIQIPRPDRPPVGGVDAGYGIVGWSPEVPPDGCRGCGDIGEGDVARADRCWREPGMQHCVHTSWLMTRSNQSSGSRSRRNS